MCWQIVPFPVLPIGRCIHEETNKKIRSTENQAGSTRFGACQIGGASESSVPGIATELRRSIDDFVCWYCSEPRLSFNKTVVTRYRIHLEDKLLAPGTINVRLAAVRRLAYEAADTGLLSPDLAAGIRRVKGAKKLVPSSTKVPHQISFSRSRFSTKWPAFCTSNSRCRRL